MDRTVRTFVLKVVHHPVTKLQVIVYVGTELTSALGVRIVQLTVITAAMRTWYVHPVNTLTTDIPVIPFVLLPV